MPLAPAPDDTYCIAIIGDFMGGNPGDSGATVVDWAPRRATPDTVMDLTGLRPRLRVSLEAGGPEEEIVFSSMEDFDPRTLFEKLPAFEPFRSARDRAARGGLPTPSTHEASEQPPGGEPQTPGLLDAIIEASHPPASPEGPLRTREELDAFVREAVRPYLVDDDSDARARVSALDRAASQILSRLIHTPSFQRLERVWRSVVFLLSRIDTSAKVRVYLVHLPRKILEEDLSSASDPTPSRLRQLLSTPDLGAPGRRWAVAVGAYELSMGGADLALMEKIASVAQAARTPWLSAVRLSRHARWASPSSRDLAEADADPPEAWTAFRARPEAEWIGLTFPRFLLREPDREDRSRAGTLAFREDAALWDHLLWGHGPFPVAALLARGYATDGRSFRPESHLELGGVPMAAPAGEEDARPRATEIPLSADRASHLVESGIIPLLEMPRRAALRVGGLPAVGVGCRFPPRDR